MEGDQAQPRVQKAENQLLLDNNLDDDTGGGFGASAGLWSAWTSRSPAAGEVRPAAPSRPQTAVGLADSLTVLVFTSAVPSDPSLRLLETTLGSFHNNAPALLGCRLIIVCDGWQTFPGPVLGPPPPLPRRDGSSSSNRCPSTRVVKPDRARCYAERIDALQASIEASVEVGQDSKESWVKPHWEILRLPHWHCYGRALRAGLELVTTPLVLVVQHDFAFVTPVDIGPVASSMLGPQHSLNGPLNYVGLLKKAQLHYATSVRSRSGLHIGARVSVPVPGHSPMVLERLPQLYDSTHLARADWYRGLFARRYAHDRGLDDCGQFPEDVLSEFMLQRAGKLGVHAVVEEFGTFIMRTAPVALDSNGACRSQAAGLEVPASDQVLITHVDGRRFVNLEQRAARGLPQHIPKYDVTTLPHAVTLAPWSAEAATQPCYLPLYLGQDLTGAALRVQALQYELAAYRQRQQGQGAGKVRSPKLQGLPDHNWPRHCFDVDEFMLWRGQIAALHKAVIRTKERLEGNCLCTLKKTNVSNKMENGGAAKSAFVLEMGKLKAVRRNLFLLAELGIADRILEVGFNAGHSAAVFLYGWEMRDLRLARESAAMLEQPLSEGIDSLPLVAKSHRGASRCSYIGFDLCEHEYTKLCFDTLRDIYGDKRQMELVAGDSANTLAAAASTEEPPQIVDLIHIDGGHLEQEVSNDILLCRRFAEPGKTLLLIDDTTWPAVARSVARFVEDNTLTQLDHDSVGLEPTTMHQLFLYS
mmetsp:Transcript_69048/g.174014  ORF Transcript_69048/g.174014 Transcript_69048/m.174014 type:complete len:756 (-) Transcript_69048:94-2361(-)